MNKPYVELRIRNTFGSIVDNFFKFLKYNFKSYINMYLRYNAFSIILALVAGYLLATGFLGLASRDFRFGMTDNSSPETYLGFGAAVLLFALFITTAINYSFSSAYITEYVNNRGDVTGKGVWRSIKTKFWSIVALVILGVIFYVIYALVSMLFMIIPFFGYVIRFGMNFLVSALFALTFMALFFKKNQIGEAIGDGFNYTFNNFLKVMLKSLVIGILNLIITLLVVSVPSYIMWIYAYFSIESEIDLFTSGFAKVVFTFGFALYIMGFLFAQAISQLAYGALFYNLHEEKYNTYLQQQIEQIGAND